MSEWDDPLHDEPGSGGYQPRPEFKTRQERREERHEKVRTFRTDNRRSVRLQALLSVKPKRRRK